MNVVRTIVSWLAPVAILGAWVAIFMLLGSQEPPTLREVETPTATMVRAVEAVRETSGLVIELDGVVVPLREVTLAAEVPGLVLRKAEACKAGRFVTEGTLLF